jgi:2-polyprenyl-6-methoxyphenol hydroxylase-like FAD-dependent oxidoreductase
VDVVVVGAGPVGLLLAGALARAGLDVIVLESGDGLVAESRASTLQARAMEILADHCVPRLDAVPRLTHGHYAGLPLDLTRVDSAWSGQWKLAQPELVRRLAEWSQAQGARLSFASEVVDVHSDETSAAVKLADGSAVHARYVVGCDGVRSTVAQCLGIQYDRRQATRRMVRCDLVDVSLSPRRFERHGTTVLTVGRISPEVTRVMACDETWSGTDTLTFDRLRDMWSALTGEHLVGPPRWFEHFDNRSCVARQWRVGRVLLAGDAAHQFLPVGGESLNSGLIDADNLVWKLVQSLRSGTDHLLDNYARERRSAAHASQESVQSQDDLIFSGRPEDRRRRSALAHTIADDEATHDRLAAAVSGTSVSYPNSTPAVGPRLSATELRRRGLDPDLVRRLRQQGRGLLATRSPSEWTDRRESTVAVLERRPGSAAAHASDEDFLLRPDGHLVSSSVSQLPLASALDYWFPVHAAPAMSAWETP